MRAQGGSGGHHQPPDSRHLEPPLDRLTLAKDNLPRSILLGKGVELRGGTLARSSAREIFGIKSPYDKT